MNTKLCTTCQQTKPLSDFNKNKTKKDGLNSLCKSCSQQRSKKYYSDNREHHIKVIGKLKKEYHNKMKEYINTIKSEGCLICPEKEPIAIDFHHLNSSQKEGEIAKMRRGSYSILAKEINKCILLCANCHRKFHSNIISLPSDIKTLNVEIFTGKLVELDGNAPSPIG